MKRLLIIAGLLLAFSLFGQHPTSAPGSVTGAVSDSLNTRVAIRDSSGTSEGSYRSGKAVDDSLSAHWTEIALKADDADVLKKDGSVALTADWDAGSYKITADSLVSLGLRVDNLAINTTDGHTNTRSIYNKTAGATDASDDFFGIYNYGSLNQSGGVVGDIIGIYNKFQMLDGTSGAGGDLKGFHNEVYGSTSGAIGIGDDVYGIYNYVKLIHGSYGGEVFGMDLRVDLESAITSLGNDIYGLRIFIDADKAPDSGTDKVYGLYLQDLTNIDYGFYQSGTAPNYLPVVQLDETPGDQYYSGNTAVMTVGEAVVFGQPLYIKSDEKLWECDADAVTTMPCIFLSGATISADADGVVILPGSFVNNTSWNWTVGGEIYVDTAVGTLTQTAPSGTGDQVQIVGYATHADRIFFDPDYTLVEIN